MRRKILSHAPIIYAVLGSVIAVNILTIIYRGFGLDRGSAFYFAVLSFIALAYGLVRYALKRQPRSGSTSGKSDSSGGN